MRQQSSLARNALFEVRDVDVDLAKERLVADRPLPVAGVPAKRSIERVPPARPTGDRHTSCAMVDGESSGRDVNEPSPAAPAIAREDLRHYIPRDLLDVSFPVSVRGYERGAVDAYVKQVNRVIAEVKVSASPPAAVRHALDQAGEKVDGLLQAAREAADQITTSAQEEAEENADRLKAEAVKFVVDTNAEADRLKAEADELTTNAKRDAEATLAKAKAEASEIHEGAKAEAQDTLARSQAEADERRRHLEAELAAMQEKAETQLREISADTQAVWSEHDQMLDGIRNMANDLIDIATASVARVQPHQPGASDDENPERGPRNHDEPTTVATDESASAAPTAPGKRSSGGSRRRS
jgi:DivIVA domain-containing protein